MTHSEGNNESTTGDVAGKLAGKIPDSVTSEDKNGDFGKNNPNSIFPIREIVHK